MSRLHPFLEVRERFIRLVLIVGTVSEGCSISTGVSVASCVGVRCAVRVGFGKHFLRGFSDEVVAEMLQESDFLLNFRREFRNAVSVGDFFVFLFVNVLQVGAFRVKNDFSSVIEDHTGGSAGKQVSKTVLRSVVDVLCDPEVVSVTIDYLLGFSG